MVAGNLNTTNILLGIMAGVSVLQALVLIGAVVMGFRLYRQAVQAVRDIEQRQIAPLTARVDAMMMKVDGILGDLRSISSRLTSRTERVDSAIDHTIHRIAGLAQSVKHAVRGLFNGRQAA